MKKKSAVQTPVALPEGEIRLSLRADLGGRAAALAGLGRLGEVVVDRPFVIVTGGNGVGKSTLLAAIRRTTGLVGTGLGRFPKWDGSDEPLPLPYGLDRPGAPALDLARHIVAGRDRYTGRWSDSEGNIPPHPGVLDPHLLGWRGQRAWLHDGRLVDAHDSIRGSFDMASMRRSADDRCRSHGEQMTGRLRYAIAWALGLFDLSDRYDIAEEPSRDDYRRRDEVVPREIFARLAGHRPGAPERTAERWLLLDEPETGMDPMVFARLMAMLVEASAIGRLRVFCVTHSPLALALSASPNVQVLDVDGYVARMEQARRSLEDGEARAAIAAAELERLSADTASAIAQDRGLRGQGRFTAHEAVSVPYREAIKAPYGKDDCLGNMRCDEEEEED